MEGQVKSSSRTIVSDGHHNAFAAFTRWRGEYWLAYRTATGHVARDGDIVVRRSKDTNTWQESIRLDVSGDDRDPQLLPTEDRLLLYVNSLNQGSFDISVSFTGDGEDWSEPQPVYASGFILWKPVEHEGRFYAGAHRPGTNEQREAHLVTSADGLAWEKVSTIRAGQGERETALLFGRDGKLTAFLRSQQTVGGYILEAPPPYSDWRQRPAGVHLSGHAVYAFDGVTYLMGRLLVHDPPANAAAPSAEVSDRPVDQATVVYTYDDGDLVPYCVLGPLEAITTAPMRWRCGTAMTCWSSTTGRPMCTKVSIEAGMRRICVSPK